MFVGGGNQKSLYLKVIDLGSRYTLWFTRIIIILLCSFHPWRNLIASNLYPVVLASRILGMAHSKEVPLYKVYSQSFLTFSKYMP